MEPCFQLEVEDVRSRDAQESPELQQQSVTGHGGVVDEVVPADMARPPVYSAFASGYLQMEVGDEQAPCLEAVKGALDGLTTVLKVVDRNPAASPAAHL